MKEKLTKITLTAILISIWGAAFITEPWTAKSVESWAGIILAIIGGLLLALWVVLGRVAATRNYHPATIIAVTPFFALLWTIPVAFIAKWLIKDPIITDTSFNLPMGGWLSLVGALIVCFLIAQVFFYKAVKFVPATQAGIILMLEPVTALIASYLLLSELISIYAFIGSILILVSTYLIIKQKK